MTYLTPNHPAVLAALNAETQRQRTRVDAYADDHIREMLDALTAALLHLTADDLRDTPAGRELMSAGWKTALTQLGALAGMYAEHNDMLMAENLRYAKGRIAEHNPYLEADS